MDMEWLYNAFFEHSALQAMVVLSVICALGLALGKIKVLGISLGVTFVFFVGILAGHLGFSIDPRMLSYAENFGIVLFVYALGLQVGPGFFSAFRKDGLTLNALAMGVVIVGTLFAVALSFVMQIPIGDMVGVLCGAVTNTPALAAAQDALKQLGLPNSGPALGCAVTYPLGVVGVILALFFMRRFFVKPSEITEDGEDHSATYISSYQVHNPAVFGKNLREISRFINHPFVISRIWRNGKVSIPTGNSVLEEGDRLLVISSEEDNKALTFLFGEQESTDWNKDDIDWNAIDSQLISQRILITRPELNGKKLGALKLRTNYGVNISRIYRSGVQLLASPGLRLQLGDRVTVVGEAASVKNVERVLGNAVKSLNEPNLISVFIGMMIGLVIGSIPFFIPGMDTPVRLGLAGGPVIVGILIGTFGPRMHMITYTTQSANLMLRALGLALYLACLGLDAGVHFFEVVMRPEGALWILAGFLLTVLPVLLVGLLALKLMRIDFGTVSGMLCGAMANPMALNYSNDTLPGDHPSVAYATVYPVCTFARVIIAQVVILVML